MDPTLKMKTTAALKDGILQFTPQMKAAAKYVVDHPSAFGLDSIRETARKAKVSTYTLVNMTKTLGFPSYEALRKPYRHALTSPVNTQSDPDWLSDVRDRSQTGGVYADAAKNAFSIVSNSLERQDFSEMENIVEMLFSAKTVYLTAVRRCFAFYYSTQFLTLVFSVIKRLKTGGVNLEIDVLN